MTGQRLIELENRVFAFKKETGTWPAPGHIKKPIVVWTSPEKAAKKIRKRGKKSKGLDADVKSGPAGKKSTSLKGNNKKGKDQVVMSLKDLQKMESDAGVPKNKIVNVRSLGKAGRASKAAGQPRQDEAVISLEEIKSNLRQKQKLYWG